jgi:hypothetical protein
MKFPRDTTGLSAALVLGSPAAVFAGQCPAEQVTTTGPTPGPTAHPDVADKVLTMIPLTTEKVALQQPALRLRRLVVQSGGVVAWHSGRVTPRL